jgi:hypothetical protein
MYKMPDTPVYRVSGMYKMPDMPVYKVVEKLEKVSGATLTLYHMIENGYRLISLECSTILDEIYLVNELKLKEVEKWLEI